MIYKDLNILFSEANRLVKEDLFALEKHYSFSNKLNKFIEIINIDILPEFKKCIDDFNFIIYDHKIKQKHNLKTGLSYLVNEVCLSAFENVFDDLQWSDKSGILKDFSKEKFTFSSVDLKLNTLLSIYRSSYDLSYSVSDFGSIFIFEKLNQLYYKLSKIKKSIIYNTFKLQFKFKKNWGLGNDLLLNQISLFKKLDISDDFIFYVFSNFIKKNSEININLDMALYDISNIKNIDSLSNISFVKTDLQKILDKHYSVFVYLLFIKNKSQANIFNIFLHNLSFVKSNFNEYNLKINLINAKYLALKNKYNQDNYLLGFKTQSKKNRIKHLYDNLSKDTKDRLKNAESEYINNLVTHCWKVNNSNYFLNKSQIKSILDLNLKFYKLLPGEDFDLNNEKEKLSNDLLNFLSSNFFKKDMQFDSLLSPLKSLDQWFINRLSSFLYNNKEKLSLLYKCAKKLKNTSEALGSEQNIVLSSNVLLDTYKSELELSLKDFNMILSDIEKDFLLHSTIKNRDNKFNNSCLPINKNKVENNFLSPSVFLDVKDKINGVNDTLIRIDWIRANYR